MIPIMMEETTSEMLTNATSTYVRTFRIVETEFSMMPI